MWGDVGECVWLLWCLGWDVEVDVVGEGVWDVGLGGVDGRRGRILDLEGIGRMALCQPQWKKAIQSLLQWIHLSFVCEGWRTSGIQKSGWKTLDEHAGEKESIRHTRCKERFSPRQ